MPSIRLKKRHCFNVQFSPFLSQYLACATASNYGLTGTGSLILLENNSSEHLKIRRCITWSRGLLDVSWCKNSESLLITSSCDGSLQLWSLFSSSTTNPLRIFKEHMLDAPTIDSSYHFIVSGSWDSTIKIWDVNRTQSINTIKASKGVVHSVKWSSKFTNLLLSVSDDCHLALWDKSSPLSSVHKIKPLGSKALDCDWSHWSPYEIAVSANDGTICLWDIRNLNSALLKTNSIHKPIGKIKWSPHQPDVVATTSYDLSTGIWDISKAKLLESVRHHSAFIFGLDFNKNHPGQLADCGLDSLVHVYTPWSLYNLNSRIFLKNKL